MSSVSDIQDAILEAQADVQDVMREFVREVITPQIERKARMKWAHMTPEQRDQFKTERPQEYEAFVRGMNNEQ